MTFPPENAPELNSRLQAIRKTTIAFASLFKDIPFIKRDKNNNIVEKTIVPIVYGNKEKYIKRLETVDEKIQLALPRIEYGLVDIVYDESRRTSQGNKFIGCNSDGSTFANSPVPYNFIFELVLYTRNIEDANQILEYILPHFYPDYTIKINFIPDTGISKSVPITFQGESQDEDSTGIFDSPVRSVFRTLNFVARSYIFAPPKYVVPILEADTNVFIPSSSSEFILPSGCGQFKLGEIIYQGSSFDRATAKATVESWDFDTKILILSNISGEFKSNTRILNLDRTANYLIQTKPEPYLSYQTTVTPNPNYYPLGNTKFFIPETTTESTYYTETQLYNWGDNYYGELGDNTTVNKNSPTIFDVKDNWKQISVGSIFATGIKNNGTLWAWGWNYDGQIGNSTNRINYSSPVQIGALTNWKFISSGYEATLALKNDNTLWAWGYNASSGPVLGNGTIISYSSPIQIGALTDWKQVEYTSYTSYAIKTDGTLWAWGFNREGQIGNGTRFYYSSPIQIGNLTDWKIVYSGYESAAAIKNDGSLWAWGSNGYGKLGNGNYIHYSSPIQIGALTDWKTISVGYYHALALKNDGSLWAWGRNINGQIGNGIENSGLYFSSPIQIGNSTDWKEIHANFYSSSAIKNDGSLWVWGANLFNVGNLGAGTFQNISYYNPTQIAVGTTWETLYTGKYTEEFTFAKSSNTIVTTTTTTTTPSNCFSYVIETKDYTSGNELPVNSICRNFFTNITPSISDNYTLSSLGPYSSNNVIIDNGFIRYSINHLNGALGDGYTKLNGIKFDSSGLGNYGVDDYITPGTPWEAFAFEINKTDFIIGDNSGTANYEVKIWSISDHHHIVSLGDVSIGFVTIEYLTLPRESSIRMKMTYTNSTNKVQAIRAMRGIDPDVDFNAYNNYDTYNERGYNNKNAKTFVYSLGLSSNKSLSLYAPENSSAIDYNTAILNDRPTTNISTILTGQADSGIQDDAILCAWDLGNVLPGKSVSVFCNYICSSNIEQTITRLSSDCDISFKSLPKIYGNANITEQVQDKTTSSGYVSDYPPTTLKSWGTNPSGGLGNNTDIPYYSPIQIGSLNNWKDVSSGYYHSLAAKTDNSLWAWGYNIYGQLGNSNRINYSSPIQIGSLTDWKKVSGGGYFSLAIKTNGTLWAWGYNNYGNLGNNTYIDYSSPIQVGSLTNWSNVSTFETFAAATKTDGTLWTWGYNFNSQLGNNSRSSYSSPIQIGSLTNWKQVSAGYDHTTAVKTDGTLWTWGYNFYGPLGNNNILTYSSPIQIGSLTNWKQVYSGQSSTLAIKNDNSLWGWGYNEYGQLGNGTKIHYSSPIQIGSLTNWKEVFCGVYRSYAIKTDGTLWAWGNGPLGNGVSSISYSSPIQIGSLNNWKTISSLYATLSLSYV